ncbi:MAG: DUF2911 domain-containing protein [Acidobacteriaceae bacterium]|nr:DUF2911 domain-containing protein [Acidobacteriaceae bacterium]
MCSPFLRHSPIDEWGNKDGAFLLHQDVSVPLTRRSALLTAAGWPLLVAAGRKNATIDLDGRRISIDYDALTLGTARFGRTLAPFGKVWRFGEEAPRITVNAYTLTVLFELLPGSYSLFAIPHPDHWTLIPSTATSGRVYNPSKDVGRFDVPVKTLPAPIRQLTFTLTRQVSNVARLNISIDQALVSTDLKVL